MSSARPAVFAATATLALLVAGCGSTVQTSGPGGTASMVAGSDGLGTLSAPGTDGLGAPTATSGDVPLGTSTTGGTGTGPDGSASTGGGTPAAPGTSGGGAVATGSGRMGPGVTATEILVGRSRILNAAAANAAFGNELESAPTDSYDKAVADHINARGGVAGREIKLDYYTIDASAGKSSDQLEQEMCAQWTQDKRVYAVLTGSSDNLRGCLAKKGVPQVFENVFSNSDDATFRTFRSYYEINAIGLSSLGRELPTSLAAGGYFAPGAKLGLLTFDSNQHKRAVAEHLKPALARRGLSFAEEAYAKTPRSTQDQADALSSLPGMVLAMKSAGVTHLVVFGDSGAALLVYFSKNAASQDYHPKYGITSSSGPQIVVDQGLMDPAELKGSVAAGWNPVGDVGSRPYTKYGAGYSACNAIMTKAGINIEGNDNNKVIALKTCDAFFFLKASVERGGPDVTLGSFLAGAEALGTSWASALSYGSAVTAQQRDGVSVLATTAFEEGCTCFRYRGEPRRFR